MLHYKISNLLALSLFNSIPHQVKGQIDKTDSIFQEYNQNLALNQKCIDEPEHNNQ